MGTMSRALERILLPDRIDPELVMRAEARIIRRCQQEWDQWRSLAGREMLMGEKHPIPDHAEQWRRVRMLRVARIIGPARIPYQDQIILKALLDREGQAKAEAWVQPSLFQAA